MIVILLLLYSMYVVAMLECQMELGRVCGDLFDLADLALCCVVLCCVSMRWCGNALQFRGRVFLQNSHHALCVGPVERSEQDNAALHCIG